MSKLANLINSTNTHLNVQINPLSPPTTIRALKEKIMKKIYVTVAEFLENSDNSDLLINRRVFKKSSYTGEIEEDGKIERYSEGSFYYDDNMHSEYLEVDIDEMYVQIDCTPIYI